MADVYWLRTVQYFGGQRAFAAEKNFDLLRPLIDITTALDPRLEIAYRYGAIFLAEASPIGAGRPRGGGGAARARAAHLPQSWRLRQDLGFSLLFLDDRQRRRRSSIEAANIPAPPFWLENLAADVLARGGDRAEARVMWRQHVRSRPSRGHHQGKRTVAAQRCSIAEDPADALDRSASPTSQRRPGRPPGTPRTS